MRTKPKRQLRSYLHTSAKNMVDCAKCLKKLGTIEKFSVNGFNIDSVFPEFREKPLCNDCRSALNKNAIGILQKKETAEIERQNKLMTKVLASPLAKVFSAPQIMCYLLYNSPDKQDNLAHIHEIIKRFGFSITVGAMFEMNQKKLIIRQSYRKGAYSDRDIIKLTSKGEEWVQETVLSTLDEASGPNRSAKDVKVIQILLDFSALKDALSKGGIVMTTYNCPKCNAAIDLPEAGKVLVCGYCGTRIKPVDIFEKIRSLL
jgi:DNA-directed RNA polymerase subunit RPC12/RpoP